MLYIIDGHNLIGQNLIPGIRIDDEDDEWRLVKWLQARQSNLRAQIVVVFDGGVPGGKDRALSGGGVTAMFAARYHTDADNVILNRVRKAADPKQLTIVTQDGELRAKVARLGANVMRPEAFLERLSRPPRRGRGRTAPISDDDGEAPFKEDPRLAEDEVNEFLRLFGEDPS
jgi:predicted RNA-binding protein with PIN domain